MFEDFLWALWLAAAGIYPLGFMLGSSCSPCCGGCGISDGKPRTDPKDEGTWTPSGTWTGVGGATWTFTANPGDESGETWFFYGSSTTSKVGGGATTAEQRDWGNICNWYSNKTTSPSSTSSLTTVLNKRATRLPPTTAVVHIYSDINTTLVGPQVVKNAYFWQARALRDASELTTTAPAYDSTVGTLFLSFGSSIGGNTEGSVIHNGARFFGSTRNSGSTVNGGAVFNNFARNEGTVNGGAVFYNDSRNSSGGIVNGGAVFYYYATNRGNSVLGHAATVNDGAVFNENSSNTSELATVNGGAVFNGSSINGGDVNGGGSFYDTAKNYFGGTVNDGASFYGSSRNEIAYPVVNGGAVFYDNSRNGTSAVVNGGAVFNGSSVNGGSGGGIFPVVNDGATFNDNSKNGDASGSGGVNGGAVFNNNSTNGSFSYVNGGAVFNDAACSLRTTGSFYNVPCDRKFVAHPTDIPTCNGTAPAGCDSAADTCGCG